MCVFYPITTAQLDFQIRHEHADPNVQRVFDESVMNIIILLRHLDTIHKTIYALCIVFMIYVVGKIVFTPLPYDETL